MPGPTGRRAGLAHTMMLMTAELGSGAAAGRSGGPLRKQDLAKILERQIVEGVWVVGSRIPSERELGHQYGVSRPVVREVIASLAERNFLEIQPGRGSYVRGVSRDHLSESLTDAAHRAGITARDLVVARVALEGAAVELAAENPDRDVAALRSALAEHDSAQGVFDQARTDLAYHEALVAASASSVLVLMFGSIRAQVFDLMLRSHSDPTVQQAGDPMHQDIVNAVEAGDGPEARRLMTRHLELALEYFGPDLDRPIVEVLRSRGISGAGSLPAVSDLETRTHQR